MKVGVIGSGVVGTTLAAAFLKEGNEVMVGTRDVTKPDVVAFLANNPGMKAGTFPEAAAFADIVVLAVAGPVAVDVVNLAGAANLKGKAILDTTNPISGGPADGLLPFFTTGGKSLLELIQEAVPESYVVKCFNSTGSSTMYKPNFDGVTPTMFICGNNDDAKAKTTEILNKFGWEAEDVGPAAAARAIEGLAIIWCAKGFRYGDWYHAFKVLHK